MEVFCFWLNLGVKIRERLCVGQRCILLLWLERNSPSDLYNKTTGQEKTHAKCCTSRAFRLYIDPKSSHCKIASGHCSAVKRCHNVFSFSIHVLKQNHHFIEEKIISDFNFILNLISKLLYFVLKWFC